MREALAELDNLIPFDKIPKVPFKYLTPEQKDSYLIQRPHFTDNFDRKLKPSSAFSKKPEKWQQFENIMTKGIVADSLGAIKAQLSVMSYGLSLGGMQTNHLRAPRKRAVFMIKYTAFNKDFTEKELFEIWKDCLAKSFWKKPTDQQKGNREKSAGVFIKIKEVFEKVWKESGKLPGRNELAKLAGVSRQTVTKFFNVIDNALPQPQVEAVSQVAHTCTDSNFRDTMCLNGLGKGPKLLSAHAKATLKRATVCEHCRVPIVFLQDHKSKWTPVLKEEFEKYAHAVGGVFTSAVNHLKHCTKLLQLKGEPVTVAELDGYTDISVTPEQSGQLLSKLRSLRLKCSSG